MRVAVALVCLIACGRSGFDPTDAGDGPNGDASIVTPRCTVPARPDVASPRITLGCDPIVAAQEILKGGVIRFDCAMGVQLGAVILVNKDTVIDGHGVVLDGQGITKVFLVNNNAHLTLLDVTVTRGASSDDGAAVTLDSIAGGLVAFDSTFTDNHAAAANQSGGAIAARPAQPTVEIYGGRFSNNTSASGGAVSAFSNLTIMNASFDNNVAVGTGGSDGEGGAVQFAGTGAVTMCGDTFTANVGAHNGGAIVMISIDNSSIMQMTDVVVDFNRAAGAGGAYLQGFTTLTMQRVSITSNAATAGPGGGLWLSGTSGMFTGENVSIVANRADNGTGAGMFAGDVPGRFSFSTIADNFGNCAGCNSAAIANGGNIDYRATIIVDNASQTTPAACAATGTNSGGTWQWPGDLPLCVAGATVTDPLILPRGNATGPAGTLLVRRPSSGSPAIGAVTSGCPTEDVLGNPRATPCAAGAVEP
ncbi:MAG TPA: hypothetical protein VMZ53_18290 [Kofleriaceae bacterium]|nr:hypothetical protein [Kofleriaceae bacterium]